ncbi:hypothetical protein B0H16DRAFT_1842735 [Mycena metata]|uniref:F-box domain-containing protein n=1 Tax=Mycena metata TaxID=1033252 RepID=A0AAD7IX86_9AGAR|nr:hypothetical protein B0H16DRAFT_1842735 [Mycena metata]
MSLQFLRRRSLPQHRRATGVPPEALLPIELWECIFHELGLLTGDTVWTLSATCRAFNQLCMSKYLTYRGVSPQSLASGNITIDSDLLAALQWAFCISALECLSCNFGLYWEREDMLCLQNIVSRSSSIRKLELTFYGDVSRRRSGKVVVNAFRDIMASMAERVKGPTVFVRWQDIFTCRPQDIRGWKIHKFHFAGTTLRNRVLATVRSPRPLQATVRLHDGGSASVFPISGIRSAYISEIPSITTVPGQPQILHPGDELSVVLPHLTLPELTSITLNTDSTDSIVLSQFLARHKHIKSFEYYHFNRGADTIITHALALPHLNHIRSREPANLIHLLNIFKASPNLTNFGFDFDRSTFEKIAAQNVLLQRLKLHIKDIHLELHLTVGDMLPLDEHECTVVRSLTGVVSVEMDALSYVVIQDMFPWLRLLPRLEKVESRTLETPTSANERRKFLQEVKAALSIEVVVPWWTGPEPI